ncbi:MAG: hypothetical protein JWP46_10, partial [Modestobacter sp.]|nr:hypothetical protein [Modestobacter sp.]
MPARRSPGAVRRGGAGVLPPSQSPLLPRR